MGLGEYATTKLPIPLAGAAKFIYEELKDGGMKASDAVLWMGAAISAAASGGMGVELKPAKEYKTPASARTR